METASQIQTNGQKRLHSKLEEYKKKFQFGNELSVKWLPGQNSRLSGEVKGKYIFIYDETIETALETLKHEIMDYAVSKTIEPYMQVTNKLISLLNERAYQQKEHLVEQLIKIL